MIKIIYAWKSREGFLAGFAVTAAVMLWPAVPLKGLDIWLKTMTGIWYTLLLYPVMAALTGSFASLYVYNYKFKTCSINPSKGISASLVGTVLGACPACIPAIAFFLPLSLTVTLSYFSWAFLLTSVIILVFAIYKTGGFERKSW